MFRSVLDGRFKVWELFVCLVKACNMHESRVARLVRVLRHHEMIVWILSHVCACSCVPVKRCTYQDECWHVHRQWRTRITRTCTQHTYTHTNTDMRAHKYTYIHTHIHTQSQLPHIVEIKGQEGRVCLEHSACQAGFFCKKATCDSFEGWTVRMCAVLRVCLGTYLGGKLQLVYTSMRNAATSLHVYAECCN